MNYFLALIERLRTTRIKWAFNPNPSGFLYRADYDHLSKDSSEYDFDKHIPVFDSIHQALLFVSSTYWSSLNLHLFLCFGNSRQGRKDKYTDHGIKMYRYSFSLASFSFSKEIKDYVQFVSEHIPHSLVSDNAVLMLSPERYRTAINNPDLYLAAAATEANDDYCSPAEKENYLRQKALKKLLFTLGLYSSLPKLLFKIFAPDSRMFIAKNVSRWTSLADERFPHHT